MALEQLPMLPGQTTLVERVRYQLAVGTPFLFLTGDSGSGKTVLCEKICSAVENDYLCAFVPCSEVPSLLKLRELLLQQLSPTTVFNAEDKLLGTVQRINFNTSKVVIVVDNIDKAPDSFLIELAEIYQTYKSQELFNIILTSATSWADARVRSLKEIGITPIEIEIPYLNNQDKLNELEYYLRQYGVKVSDRDLVNIPEIEKKCSPEDVRKLAQKLTDKNKESAMNNDTKSVEKKEKNKVEKETAKVNKTSKVSLILTMCALVIAVGVLGFVWYKQSNTNIVFSKNVPDNSLKQTPPSQLNLAWTVNISATTPTKCNIYFNASTLSNRILNIAGGTTVIAAKTTPNFANISTTDEGMFATTDDYGTSYYYRGAVTTNNVIFGGFCWKVIRVNGDGTTRMIYNGSPTNGTCVATGTSTQIGTGAFNSTPGDNAYVGYMYGSTSSSSYAATHSNNSSSAAKSTVESWYSANLTSYASKISDTEFCND